GHAYHCYSTPDEIEAMREKARALGLKPRYDGTWRPETGKILPTVPVDRKPVLRFRNPSDGVTAWNDLIKGPISFDNSELDDLIIARPDGTPTYNFCVVVDDWDMKITHVLRGDDHINNTPRQINILRALGGDLPEYGHLPMILGPDGEKLSKRHGAVSVMDYDAQGYLPEAMVNYLARLGWSHGNDEIFSREQLVAWFDTRNLSKSAAQWDPKKLNWVNAHYIKQSNNNDLATKVAPRITALGGNPQAINLPDVMGLFKDRAETLNQLAQGAMLFCSPWTAADDAVLAEFIDEPAKALLNEFAAKAAALPDTWVVEDLDAIIKAMLAEHGIKMPKLAIPLRLAVTGQKQTPAISAVLCILGRDLVLQRLQNL
ncbi:glutamate--tRNA ligase, partial [Photobacterium phosphoreum]|nr:glutamate--tRNA ligase [Photobacterium phosphoreum]